MVFLDGVRGFAALAVGSGSTEILGRVKLNEAVV